MKYFLKLLLCIYCLSATFAEGIDIATTAVFSDGSHQENSPKIDVIPKVNDNAIASRLKKIMKTTGWYTDSTVIVKEGIVFLKGRTTKREYKQWAENLASKMQDVVAIVNQIEITNPYPWDFNQWSLSFQKMSKSFIQGMPLYIVSMIVIFITWLISHVVNSLLRKTFFYSKIHPLLAEIIAKGARLFLFLIGFYIVLQIMGWTTIALTIAGGTGLLGIIIGMAFRDIAENLLASVLLSVQRPFKNGDLIEVDGVTGYVESLTLRATMLITAEGNHVQIPNSTIYKAKICNFTNTPNRREEFTITLPFTISVTKSQELIQKILSEHPAVLPNPEPLVLVDSIENNSVKICIYFWLNGSKHDALKVRSSIIRSTKGVIQHDTLENRKDVKNDTIVSNSEETYENDSLQVVNNVNSQIGENLLTTS